MSRPKIVVSAVAPIPEDKTQREIWEEEIKPVVDDYYIEKYDEDDYRFCEGYIDDYTVSINSHSVKNFDCVVEVVFQEGTPKEINIRNLEEKLKKINNIFDIDFTLEVYYWYTGGDKTGAEYSK